YFYIHFTPPGGVNTFFAPLINDLKTFLDNTNGIIEELPTKRQLGLGVLGIGLIVGIAIWLYNGNALDKKANKEKKANKDEKTS
ncbi:unnamed protein product, partial [Prunus brigantina]